MDRSSKVRKVFLIMVGMLRQESRYIRVIMGYLLGIAILGWHIHDFLGYVLATGEPVNIWEAFVVMEQSDSGILFLPIGYFLVIADAPFIRPNTYLMLYRSGRREWNMGMLTYILVQAFLYVIGVAGITVAVSSFIGFHGRIWSSPVYMLTRDYGSHLAAQYHVSFPWVEMMKAMTPLQAFVVTVLYLFSYIVFLGALLYVCNLAFHGCWGMMIAAGVHLLGYIFKLDGDAFMAIGKYSLLCCAVPGYFVDRTARYWGPPCMFWGAVIGMAGLSLWLVRKVDFQAAAEGEG